MNKILKSPEQGGLSKKIYFKTTTYFILNYFSASNNLVSRYDVDKVNDGIGGEEGAFSLCTLWAVEALCRAGQWDKKALSQSVVMLEDFMGVYIF